MAVPIPQPFTAYLPPCLEALYREGAAFGKADTKHCLTCIALHYVLQARQAEPKIRDDGYSLIPMLKFINNLSQEGLTDEEIELIAEDVLSTGRRKITCRELRKSETLKNLCVSEDCLLSNGPNYSLIPVEISLQDLTKATGRILRVNPETGLPEPDPETGETLVPKLTLSPSKAFSAIMKAMPLRRSVADTKKSPDIWRYEDGIWLPDGEEVIENLISRVAGDLSHDRGRQEILRRIRGLAQRVAFDADPYLLPAQDGVIDLKTGAIADYQPDDYITFKYGAAIDREGDYRPVLWFLCSSLPDPRDVLTALDICAEAVIRRPSDCIVQLIGPGANGKGMFERLISALVTDGRITNITLQEAKASRFGPGAVLGKDLWILSEVEEVKVAVNLLKKVATGERMDSDLKYGGRIQGKPHSLPILDCNNAIEFGDDSWGRKRRIIKLDWPYKFDYASGTRRKDPHIEEKITSPEALIGLLKIIVARAPQLIESRRIYNRKRPEEMAEEYKRQQYSLYYFCEECLTTNEEEAINTRTGMGYPGGPPRLTTTELYEEYLEYCRLFHVPVPADMGPIGKYINEKFQVSSVSTTDGGKRIRYYPGLWISRSAKIVHAELTHNYKNYNKTTDKLQEEDSKSDIYNRLTTATTEGWPKEVIEEIVRMSNFIESCEDPQEISYENYLKNAVVPIVAVVSSQTIAISERSPVVKSDSSVVELEMGYRTILILKALPTFVAVDGRNYTLHAQDVVSLPEIHAKNLIDKLYAKEICPRIGPHPRRNASARFSIDDGTPLYDPQGGMINFNNWRLINARE